MSCYCGKEIITSRKTMAENDMDHEEACAHKADSLMSFKDTEEWGGIWGMDSNVHPIYVSKVRVIDEGSCNGCTRQHGPDARTEPDACVWMVDLRSLSFRLCSECMTTLRSEIKWKVG